MPISREQAYELVELIGVNWNLDPNWKQSWFMNTSRLFHATFKEYDHGTVQNCVFTILQDNVSKKIPPFAEIKNFIIKKAGAAQMRSPELNNHGCTKCPPRIGQDRGGTRRIYALVSIDGRPEKRFEFIARCTCARGAQNTRALNHEQFSEQISGGHAYRLFGLSDPAHVQLIDYAISSFNPTRGSNELPAHIPVSQPLPSEEIREERRAAIIKETERGKSKARLKIKRKGNSFDPSYHLKQKIQIQYWNDQKN